MPQRPLRHRIVHTRNKHSRAVYQDDTIIIRLARGLSKTEERDHIESLLRRMTKQVLDEQQKTIITPFEHILSGEQSGMVTLASGKRYLFTLVPGAKTQAQRTRRGWNIQIGPRTRRQALHRFLWKLLSEAEQKHIESIVHRINDETFGVRIRGVRLKFAATQWGSCSPKGTIMMNTALLFTSPSILKYVIVHELAHRRRGDHSPIYWSWVEWAMPTYEKAREALKEYCLPTL